MTSSPASTTKPSAMLQGYHIREETKRLEFKCLKDARNYCLYDCPQSSQQQVLPVVWAGTPPLRGHCRPDNFTKYQRPF